MRWAKPSSWVKRSEGFSCKSGQVVDMLRLAVAEERLQ